jgi:outer membrane protein assembly factor BamD (BamD/ComL family)
MNRRVLILAPLLLACGPFFYQAPPPLDAYPQRTPGKSWRELFQESRPAAADAMVRQEIIGACRALPGELPLLPAAERLARIDALLARNRAGEFSGGAATFLHELRELAADDALLRSAADYLAWRGAQPEFGTGAPGGPPSRSWDWSDDEYAQAQAAYEAKWAAARQRIDELLAQAPAPLKPHLMVCRAEFLRASRRPAEALAAYKEVMAAFPHHPRAEVAAFMKGRCRLDLAREMPRDAGEPRDKLLGEAADDFRYYLERHPQGRFIADAHGWLGGVATDQGDLFRAISCHLKRLDLQPERETLRATLRECDGIFAAILGGAVGVPDWQLRDLPWKEIAAHPEFARLFVAQALDPEARGEVIRLDRNLSGDRAAIDFLEKRLIQTGPRTRLALEHLAGAMAAARPQGDAVTLGVLGWSSLRGGDFPQALVLFQRALEQGGNEDLLYGKARALAGLGRHRDAWETYRQLTADVGAGSLGKACAFEAAVARFHAGEAGEALLMLVAMRPENEWLPEALLRPEYEPAQWIDTMAQFAPLDQLAAPLARLPEADPHAALLRAIVRTRALCAGDFDTARRHLDPPAATVPPEQVFEELPRGIGLTAAIWDQEIEPLVAATRAIDAAPANFKAGRHLRLARLWQAQRGRLTMPLHHLFDFSRSETWKLEQLRRKNAALLDLDDARVTAELDSRDELHHALRHFLAAAESPDPDIAAPALEEANEALFRLAEFSLYRCSRAVETDAAALSRELVGRLQRDFPDRPESRRAVVWSFTPPALLGRWMPGDYNPANSAEAIAVAVVNPDGTLWDRWSFEPGKDAKRLGAALQQWLDSPEQDLAVLRRQFAELRADFDRTRADLREGDLLALVDDLDDLGSAVQAPGITADLFRRYAALRRGGAPVPPVAGEWLPLAPWLDFLACLRRVDPANPLPAAAAVGVWEKYLKQYPQGPKSEAASFRLLRLQVRALSPVPQVQAFHFPDAPIPHGYKRLASSPAADPTALRALVRALDDHEKRFPGGRYRADLTLLRGALASKSGEDRTALKCLSAVLADPAHPELRLNASLYFSELSLRLLDRRHRPALAAAFRAERQALPYLKNLAHGDTCLFRLRPLLAWLEG